MTLLDRLKEMLGQFYSHFCGDKKQILMDRREVGPFPAVFVAIKTKTQSFPRPNLNLTSDGVCDSPHTDIIHTSSPECAGPTVSLSNLSGRGPFLSLCTWYSDVSQCAAGRTITSSPENRTHSDDI